MTATDASSDERFGWSDAGEAYDGMPTITDELAELALLEAELVEAQAEATVGLTVIADALHDALKQFSPNETCMDATAEFVALVRAAGDRATLAAATARRATNRILALVANTADGSDDDRSYEDILTARLYIPIAGAQTDDARTDAVTALRHLARATLASSMNIDNATELERRARGVLRLTLPGLASSALADEQPALWSVNLDELRHELAGLLAQLLIDHRTYLIVEHTGRPNRFVQALSHYDGLLLETVADQYLDDDPLTDHDRALLTTLGWEKPQPVDEGSPNWHRHFDGPVDVHHATDLLVRTLVEIHHLDDPSELRLTVNRSDYR